MRGLVEFADTAYPEQSRAADTDSQAPRDLATTLAAIYGSEINVTITCLTENDVDFALASPAP